MLLKQIVLRNIRSYIEETVSFPEGSCLLSGDIGSGKSTILFAIEFALFGASRTDLPAEALLRKGTTQGSAELTFILEGKEIIIKRGLKKEKESIKQTTGYIIINNLKKELTPLELKAEIITLLGYPEEFLTKTKNYIYQYTVYTPQEEMKSILQENGDVRLDTLRKIFNVDKYKIIRENVQSYLRFMREQMRILEARLEPLDGMKQHTQKIQDEESAVQESLQLVEPRLAEERVKLQQQRDKVDLLEQQQRQYQELQHQYNTLQAVLRERQEQIQRVTQQQHKLQQEHHSFAVLEEVSLEEVVKEKKELEQQRQSLLTQQTLLRERITHIQGLIPPLQLEIQKMKNEITFIPDKEKQLQQLTQEAAQRPAWQEKKKQFEELFFKIAEMITKNETWLAHSLELQQKIKTLEVCPTCLQTVSAEHKHGIEEAEKSKIAQAEHLLFEFKKKRGEIVQEREQVQEQLERLRLKENIFPRLQLELQQLLEKRNQLPPRQEQLAALMQDNNTLRSELALLQQERTVDKINNRLQQLQEIQDIIVKKKFLTQRLEEVSEQLVHTQQQIAQLVSQSFTVQQQLEAHPDPLLLLKGEKVALTELLQLEKSFSVQQAQLQTQLQSLQQQKSVLQENIEKLTDHTYELSRRKEIYHWLEEYFLNITYTLEKHIMLNIHALFNQLFQDWFSILITDEGMASRIDDSFYPVIEQNGYEVPFSMLSGGEKTSAALAYRLALNRVINDVIHQIKTKDVLILDEPTDGFSSEQLDKVREVLEKLNLVQTIIVSHESKIESFVEKVIRIQKEGHVSKVLV